MSEEDRELARIVASLRRAGERKNKRDIEGCGGDVMAESSGDGIWKSSRRKRRASPIPILRRPPARRWRQRGAVIAPDDEDEGGAEVAAAGLEVEVIGVKVAPTVVEAEASGEKKVKLASDGSGSDVVDKGQRWEVEVTGVELAPSVVDVEVSGEKKHT